jgi:AhpD family alkylhydroperoxidase
VFGHHPEYGTVFTDLVMAILKDGELDWLTKELLILKATQRNECQYCVVQHERVSEMLGMEADKIADLEGERYKSSPHFSDGERALIDLTVQIGEDANRIPKELWERVHAHWSEPQIVEAPTSWSPSSATPSASSSSPCSMA